MRFDILDWNQWIVLQAVAMTVLALLVTSLAPRLTRPQLRHGLWLAILFKLVIPPFVFLAVVPRPAAPVSSLPELGSRLPSTAVLATEAAPRTVDATTLAMLAWAIAALAIVGVTAWRARRFQLRVAASSRSDAGLQSRAAALASRMGLRRCPKVMCVDAQISPAVWGWPGRPKILLPERLVGRLGAAEVDTVLAHELAHVVRRDPWIRLLEVVALALYWWHPGLWWVRRQLRRAEEESCDSTVVQVLPKQRKAYARALLATLEFLSGSATTTAPPTAPMTSGVGSAANAKAMKARLKMIVSQHRPPKVNRLLRAAMAGALLVGVVLMPTWADRQEDPYAAELAEINQRAQDLERELRELELRRAEIKRSKHDAVAQRQAEELNREIARLETSGHSAEVEVLRQKLEAMESRRSYERNLADFERLRHEEIVKFESALKEQLVEAQKLRMDGDEAAAAEHEAQARALKLELVERNHQLEREQELLFLEWQRRDDRMQELDRARERELGLLEEGVMLEQDLRDDRLEELKRFEMERYHKDLQHKLEAIAHQVKALESAGQLQKADELRIKAKRLQRELERLTVY